MESIRFLQISLCRAVPGPNERLQGTTTTIEAEAAENPLFRRAEPDPMIVCCLILEHLSNCIFQVCAAYKKNRFYLFTNAEPFRTDDEHGGNSLAERDVFNEKPLKEDTITAVDVRLFDIIYRTY